MKIAKRTTEVSPSSTLEITALAKKMKQEGHNIVNFAAGEPDFDTPDYIKQAAINAITEGFTKYTPATGYPQLKQAIAEKFERDNQLHYLPAQIIVCCGAKHALYNIFQALCEKDDEVLIPTPYWLSYPEMVRLAEAKVKFLATTPEEGFKVNKQTLLANITKQTKVLILNSPGNPTGSVYSGEELAEIAEIAAKFNFYVISDEIYEKLIFDNRKHVSYAALNQKAYQHTIVVNGVSKTFSMTGWRIGYLASAEPKIIEAIANLQGHSTSNPCSISQKAAETALRESKQEQIDSIVEEFQSRRDCLFQNLEQLSRFKPFKPQGAFYIFCNIAKLGLDSVSLAHQLLTEAKIAVIPGKAFGRDDYIRLSFATSKAQITEGIRRLKQWVENKA